MGSSDFYKMALDGIVHNPPSDRRILSIQSHVVHGYVGNKCSVFPLQLHGYEVDPINSVQFSNHTGYKHVKGQKMDDAQLANIYEGLKLNGINNYSHILTGYCGNASFLRKIADIVEDMKSMNRNVLFYCDPVLGDNGSYYTPKDLMPIYRDILIPMADVITPNVFELSELTGCTIQSEADCLEAIDLLHKRGVKTVVVTSGLDTPTTKFCYGSVYKDSDEPALQYRFDIPVLPGVFVGSGDLFTSLLLLWMDKLNGDINIAIQKVIGSLLSLLRRTGNKAYFQKDPSEYIPTIKELELQVLQSRLDLLCPQVAVKSTRLQ